ncbi:Aste57867_3137 [Aphanomyces stellatus]|uniref:Aste57867_3137 protein n=1 Tax=Aphanomyces stellatus TaxID=120398 RepID=A0A485KAQ9_9STRA|nr:hypothetical protein As57867_003128 [Aphanomyces stellatus]VFT80313.1 Aste57867_3137 [Aphanomyces stellatus]
MSASFEAFVAQLREIYLAAENPLSKTLKPRSAPSSAFDGTWCYNPCASKFDSDILAPSTLNVFRCLTMGLCCQLAATSDGLFVRSQLALFSTIASAFVLDGRARVLRVFPNGESTMTTCAELLYGDYVGSIQSPACIRLDLYCWPVEVHYQTSYRVQTRPCYVIQLVLQAHTSTDNDRLQCHYVVHVCDDVTLHNIRNMPTSDRIELVQRQETKTKFSLLAEYRRVHDPQ